MIGLTKTQMEHLLQLVKLAGDDILEVYQNPETTELVTKADRSPLTAADLAAHKRLVAGLPSITPAPLPILSEEGSPEDYAKRHQWQSFWLIDPLDGTKEFLARNGQFTVNVALIHKGSAVLGVVYQPVAQKFYWAQSNTGAWRQIGEETAVQIFCEPLESRQQQKLSLRALVSQHHHSSASQEKLVRLPKAVPMYISA
jgi:3'(2'), 5'-bisphosphate nucleotidase